MEYPKLHELAVRYNREHHGVNARMYPEIRQVKGSQILISKDSELVAFCHHLSMPQMELHHFWTNLEVTEDGHVFLDEENVRWLVTKPDSEGDSFLGKERDLI